MIENVEELDKKLNNMKFKRIATFYIKEVKCNIDIDYIGSYDCYHFDKNKNMEKIFHSNLFITFCKDDVNIPNQQIYDYIEKYDVIKTKVNSFFNISFKQPM
jgi:hypothetical protein